VDAPKTTLFYGELLSDGCEQTVEMNVRMANLTLTDLIEHLVEPLLKAAGYEFTNINVEVSGE